MTGTVDQFKLGAFVELLIWKNNVLCLNAGYVVENILITVTTAMKFQNCYKTIIQSLTNWDNWKTKFPDECDQSNDEDISVYSYNPVVTDSTNYWYGDLTYSIGCTPGLLWAEDPLLDKAYEMGFNYLQNTYKSS